jgi:aspartate/methionine/tyrosine aminotransferase
VWSRRSLVNLEPNPLAEALDRATRAGRPTLDLTESNPTRAGLAYAKGPILDALRDERALRYEPQPLGLDVARAAVASDWTSRGIEVDASRVLLTASTSEAYSYVFKLLCDPGDQVLVPQPSYPLLEHLGRLDHVELVPYRLVYDGAWSIDTDSVEAAIGPRSRAILLVSPNNPTGNYLKQDELAGLAALGVPLVCDEVFASYPLCDDPRRATSVLETDATLVFALGGLSKLAALPQLKLGWLVLGGPRAVVRDARARLEVIADTYLSVGAAVQLALPRLLSTSQELHAAIRRRTARNLTALQASCSGSVATVLDVEGGWYAVVRLPRLISEEQWVVGLLDQTGVLVQPGWFYDFADEGIVVVSLLTPERDFDAGTSRLLEHVSRVARSG